MKNDINVDDDTPFLKQSLKGHWPRLEILQSKCNLLTIEKKKIYELLIFIRTGQKMLFF